MQRSEKMEIKVKVFPTANELLEKTKSMTHNLNLQETLIQMLKKRVGVFTRAKNFLCLI